MYNKCDLADMEFIPTGEDCVSISAMTGEGTDTLLKTIENILDKGKKQVIVHLPYAKGGLLEMLHKEGSVIRTDYFDEYIEVEVILQPDAYGKVRDYIIE